MLDLFRTLPGIISDIEGAEMLREALVFAAWRRISGDVLCDHAVPVRLTDSVLSIAVSSVTWQRHLKDLAAQMLFKLNAAIGTPLVRFIEFEIDEAAVLSGRSRTAYDEEAFRRESVKEISPELAKAAEKIGDEDLRQQFLLAAGSCLARRTRSGAGS